MRERRTYLLSVFLLLTVVIAALPGGSAVARQGSSEDEPVSAAAFAIETTGVTAPVYVYDDSGVPGTICELDDFTGMNALLVSPIQVYAVAGHTTQPIRVDTMVGSDEGNLIDIATWEGFVDESGYVWVPGEHEGVRLYGRYDDIVLSRIRVTWFDETTNAEIGSVLLQFEFYDNAPIGGTTHDACYYDYYAPTPTVLPGGFQPGDAIQTTRSTNVRTGPGTNYSVITTLQASHNGVVVGFPASGSGYTWYPVLMEGDIVGYLIGQNIVKRPATPTPTPTRTATRTATTTRTTTATQTATNTRTATNTPTPSWTPTASFTPTETFTPTNTATATLTATATSTSSVTNTPTDTATASATSTASNTATATATRTATSTPSNTPVTTDTPTATPTRTITQTPTLISGGIPPNTAVRTTASVNLRSGPGTNFAVLATVPSTARGVVTGYPTLAGAYAWYPVSFNGYPAGYMAGQYLTTAGVATVTPTRTPSVTRTATSVVSAIASETPTPSATSSASAIVTITTSPTATSSVTRTPSSIPGGFVPGDTVRAKTNVNLRTGPGTNYSILATVVSGTNGTVTGYPVVAGSYTWYPVAMNGYPAGYLAGAYLTKTGSGPTVTATRTVAPPTVTRTATTITGGFPVGAAVQVNTGSLNLRSGPGTTYTSLGLMPRGTTGTVTGAPEAVGSSLWYPVNMTGFGNGWVSGQYLTNAIVTAEDLTETPVPTDVPVTVEPTATEAIAVPTDVPEPTATDSVVAPTDVPEPTATDSVVVPPTETTAAEEPPIEEPPGEGTPSE